MPNRSPFRTAFLLLLGLLSLCPASARARDAQLFFSHYDGKSGAIGQINVSAHPPALSQAGTVFREDASFRLTRLVGAPSGHLLAINEHTPSPWLIAVDPSSHPPAVHRITLADRPTTLQLAGKMGLVSGNRGMVHLIDARRDRTVASWTPTPDSGRVTALAALPDGSAAFGVCRQDSVSGKARGHRVLVFDLPSLKLKHVLELPRNHPELHFGQGAKDSGPGPLFAVASPSTNTLLVGLNNYGAIQLSDLDAALDGKWQNVATIPTSPDGSWGTSFPSTGTLFKERGREYAIVSNGSAKGGSVVVDLDARKIAARLETGPRALPTPIHQPHSRRLVTISSGIEYSRTPGGIADRHVEPSHFFSIDLSPIDSGGAPAVHRIDLPEFVYEAFPAHPANDNLWVIALRNPNTAALSLVLFDLETRKELARIASPGVIRNFARLP